MNQTEAIPLVMRIPEPLRHLGRLSSSDTPLPDAYGNQNTHIPPKSANMKSTQISEIFWFWARNQMQQAAEKDVAAIL